MGVQLTAAEARQAEVTVSVPLACMLHHTQLEGELVRKCGTKVMTTELSNREPQTTSRLDNHGCQ